MRATRMGIAILGTLAMAPTMLTGPTHAGESSGDQDLGAKAIAAAAEPVAQNYAALPAEAQRYADDAAKNGALRVGDRMFVWPGPDGVYDSLRAVSTDDPDTLAGPTDDIVMIVQATYDDCDDGWLCLFDWRDWNAGHPDARMWQFQQVTSDYQRLSSYSANNKAVSWRNRRNHRSWISRDVNGVQDAQVKCLGGRSQDRRMDPPWRDSADGVANTNAARECP